MRHHLRWYLPLGVMIISSVADAAPVVLDFESLRHVDAGVVSVGSVYEEDGFRLVGSHFSPSNPTDLRAAGTESWFFPGSTALYHHSSLGEITLTRGDGGVFDLLSIDLIELPNGDGSGNPLDLGTSFDVTFFGTRSDGSIVSNVFTLTKFFTIQTFAFDGFTDVVSVNWFQGAGGAGMQAHQFDNIVIRGVEPDRIPEPTTLALFGLSAAGAGLACRRRRRSHSREPR